MNIKPRPSTKARSPRGFRRADALLQSQIRTASEGRGFAVSRLLTHWAEVAGAEVSKATRPVRISYGRDGFGATLTLLTSGANAPIVQTEIPKLIERVNACYGYAAVTKIRLTQTAPDGFYEGQAEFKDRHDFEAPTGPDDEDFSRAREIANEVENSELRQALEGLGSQIISRQNKMKSN